MQHFQCGIFFATIIFLIISEVQAQEASPCPRIFTYEPKGPEPDRWYGLITLLHDSDLNGVWLRIVFDKPILQLGNWFGEVAKRGHTDYLIKNPGFQLKARTPKVVRIFVKYNMYESPPKLMEFRINAKVVCPEIVTTTTSTTTERLFTSIEEEKTPDPYAVDVTNVGTTTHRPVDSTSNFPGNGGEILPNPTGVERPTQVISEKLEEICGTVAEHERQERHIGQVAHKGEFPWHAMLYYSKDITIAYLCGAALISKHHLLTVAHCVIKSQSQAPVNPERLIVYLGKYYVKHWAHEGSKTRYVEEITPHPDYNSDTYDNDIAVLKLLYPAEFTNFIRPICLWNEPTDDSVTNRPGTVVGWGFDEMGKIEDKLMFVQMFAQENEVCNRTISNYTERFTSRKTYCANFIDDTVECVGDSGGAMVFPRLTPNRTASVWQLRGLVTVSVVLQHQLKCGRDRYVVFTDVTKYHDWIKENTNVS